MKAQHTQTQQGLFVADNATRIKKCFAEELRGSDSSSGLKNELRRNREKKKNTTLGNGRPGFHTQLYYSLVV